MEAQTTREIVQTASLMAVGVEHARQGILIPHVLLQWHNKFEKWIQPGGEIEQGELAHEAALRKFREETGLTLESIDGFSCSVLEDKRSDPKLPNPVATFLIDTVGIEKYNNALLEDRVYRGTYDEEISGVNKTFETDTGKHQWYSRDDLCRIDRSKIPNDVLVLAQNIIIDTEVDLQRM